MILLGIISEALLYICFSVLIGSFFLSLVPEAYRPTIHVKKGILMMAASGIAIFSFIPVLQLIFIRLPRNGITASISISTFHI